MRFKYRPRAVTPGGPAGAAGCATAGTGYDLTKCPGAVVHTRRAVRRGERQIWHVATMAKCIYTPYAHHIYGAAVYYIWPS